MEHRIVCLVPSLTEWLCTLGLEKQLVGITKFCIHPSQIHSTITHVGGTKNPNIDQIRALNPTVVVMNREENRPEDAAALESYTQIFLTEINSIRTAFYEMRRLARFFEKEDHFVDNLEAWWSQAPNIGNGKSVLYLIWRKPFMAAGGDTYISSVLGQLGYKNVLKDQNRYPTLTEQQIIDCNPDLIFLSSEPFPFMEKHVVELQKMVPTARVQCVDGELYSWYGTRMKWIQNLLGNF
jgi:ABC-type Fe3+-hydroxamate transport system substrate-binding protein